MVVGTTRPRWNHGRMTKRSAGSSDGNALFTAVRGPLIAIATCVLLLLVAFALDSGGERARDAALLVGAPTLYLLLPAAVLWLLIAVLRQLTRRRRTD
jgi:hypothetical protein